MGIKELLIIILFGIILFLLWNHKDTFSIGILNENDSCVQYQDCRRQPGDPIGGVPIGGVPCLSQCRCTNLSYDLINQLIRVDQRALRDEGKPESRRPWEFLNDRLNDGIDNYTCKDVYEPWRYQIKFDCNNGTCEQTDGLGEYETIGECTPECTHEPAPESSPILPSSERSGVLSNVFAMIDAWNELPSPSTNVCGGGHSSCLLSPTPVSGGSAGGLSAVPPAGLPVRPQLGNINMRVYIWDATRGCANSEAITLLQAYRENKRIYIDEAYKKWVGNTVMGGLIDAAYKLRKFVFNCNNKSIEWWEGREKKNQIQMSDILQYEITQEYKPSETLMGIETKAAHTNYIITFELNDDRTMRIKSTDEDVISNIFHIINTISNIVEHIIYDKLSNDCNNELQQCMGDDSCKGIYDAAIQNASITHKFSDFKNTFQEECRRDSSGSTQVTKCEELSQCIEFIPDPEGDF